MINSFYYGKAGQADFTPDKLPTNRAQLFFEVLRVRFSGLFMINLLNDLFLIPMFAIVFFFSMALTMEGANPVADGTLFMTLVLLVPCLMLAGVGSCGTSYVLRNWARDQHAFVLSDFKDAVKGNWKMGLLIGFLNGLSLIITYICVSFYGQAASDTNVFFVIPQMFVIMFCAVWWMMNMIIFPMMVTYDMGFKNVLRNSMIMVVARLPWSVLIWGGSVVIPAVVLVFVPYGVLIFVLVYLLLGFALSGLIYASYANSCFDRFLNPKIEGASVNMGLRDPVYDEDDEEEASEENG